MAAESSNTHKRATPVAVAFLLLMPLALAAFTGSAVAATLYSEGWENGWGSWSVTGPTGGAAIDCTVARSGSCSLKLAAPSTAYGQYVLVSNMPAISLSELTVSFGFRGSNIAGNADAEFQLFLNGGTVITYAFTEGGNNYVRLSAGAASHEFGSWSTVNTWYEGRILINPTADTVYAELRNNAGGLIASSNTLSLLSTDSAIQQIRILGVSWGDANVYHIDTISMVDGINAVAPSAPTNPQAATGPNAGEISLTWSPPSSNGGLAVTSYKVYRSTTSSGSYTLVGSSTTTSWLDTSLPAGATRHYRLSAVNAVGESGLTSPVSATTHDVPSAPQALAATPGQDAGEIELTWQAPLNNGGLPVTSYQIHAADAANGPYTQVGTSTSASFLHEGLANNITKHYRIRAVNAAGAGAESNTASATTLRAPSAPQQLQAVPGPETIFLHWKAPADTGDRPIDLYRVLRGTSSVNKQDHADSVPTVFPDSAAPGVTYYYQVSAVTAIGESPRSNEAKATALGPTDSTSEGVRSLFFLDNATLSAGELPSVPLLPAGTPPVDTPDYAGSDPVPTPDVDPTPGVGPVASLVVWDRAATDETCVDVVVGSTRQNIACWPHEEVPGHELIPHEETPIGIPPTPGQDVPDAPSTDPQDVPDAEETLPGEFGATPTSTPEIKVSVNATYRFDAARLWKAAGLAGDAIRVFTPVAPSNAGWWAGSEGAAQALVVRVTVWHDGEMLDTRELVIPHVGQALAAAEYTASTQP